MVDWILVFCQLTSRPKVLYITWRDDHVHGTVGIYIAWRNDHVRCRLYYSVRLAVDMDIHGYIHEY